MRKTANQFAIAAMLLVSIAQSVAQPSTYSERRNPINCGILLIPETNPATGGTNADPFTFYNLLKRTDLLPPGWDFINPFAPSVVSDRILSRWKAIVGGTPFLVGDKIQRNMAPYWEVNLDDLSDRQLAYYDILVIHAPGRIFLRPEQRERLRRFIDGGGVLWFDKATSQTVDQYSGFPYAFTVSGAGSNPQVFNPMHPLLNYPHKLTFAEAVSLGQHNGGHSIPATSVDFDRFNVITANSAGGVIMEADLGTGHFVVTACNVVSDINEPAGGQNGPYGRNSGVYAGQNFLNIPASDLKFAYNVVALTSTYRQSSQGSRKLNSSPEDLSAPLLEQFSVPNTPQHRFDDDGRYNKSPIFFKGLLIVSDGNGVFAYDMNPRADLDGDGNGDDGVPDLYQGKNYDLVWSAQCGSSDLSTPLAIEVSTPFTTNVPKNQIWVMDAQGSCWVMNAFPTTGSNGRLASQQTAVEIQAPVNMITAGGTMIAPVDAAPNALTYADGMIFAASGWKPGTGNSTVGGFAWILSPKTMSVVALSKDADPFVASGDRTQPTTRPFNTSPSVAYVPQTDSGAASDQMIYLGFDRTVDNNRGNAGFAALWFKSKGEKLELVGVDNSTGTPQSRFRSRASSLNLYVYDGGTNLEFAELNPRYYFYDINGNPITPPGGMSVGLSPGDFIGQGNFTGISVYADYTINWAKRDPQVGNLAKIARTVLVFQDDATPTLQVTKSIAVAPNGNIFMITLDHDFNGGPKSGASSLWCFRERLNATTLLYRWSCHGGYTHNLGGTSTTAVPPVVQDTDDLTKMIPFLNQPMQYIHFHGTPVIHNNVAYVVMSARKRLGFFELPVTAICAFDADPQPAEIRLGGPITGSINDIEISQPDPSVSLNKDLPSVFNRLNNQPGNNSLDVDAAQGIIRVNNFMSSTKGTIQNPISVSQPVAVRLAGQPSFFVDPNATGSHWSTLKWYMVWNGFSNEANLMVTGDTVFMAGGWAIEDFVCRTGPINRIPTPRAVVVAMDAEIPTNDEFLRNDTRVPNNTISNRQLLYAWLSPTGLKWNNHVKWPSGEGTTDLDDFCIRVRQVTVGNSQRAMGLIAGDGKLAAWALDGTYMFEKALTLIADQGRVVEIDSSGFPGWSSDNTYAGAINAGNLYLKVAKISMPTKAYKLGPAEYLIVDTAANKVVRIDRAGFELRSIESFNVDAGLIQSGKLTGYNVGDPLSLRQPEDVQTWADYIPKASNPFANGLALEYWVHYLIADTGNGRLVEIVDRYAADPATFAVGGIVTNGFGQLVYHSPLNALGKRYRYHTVGRVLTSYDQTTLKSTWAIVTAVGNWEATGASAGIDPFNQNADLQAYSGNGAIFIESFDTSLPLDQRFSIITRVKYPDGTERSLIGPATAQVIQRGVNADGSLQLSVLVADQKGIVEFLLVKNGLKWEGRLIWEFTNGNYLALRGVEFVALSARKLVNGNVLITNNWTGLDSQGRPFTGEVIELRASDYNALQTNNGFSNAKGSVRAEIPPIQGTRSLRQPTFADRQ